MEDSIWNLYMNQPSFFAIIATGSTTDTVTRRQAEVRRRYPQWWRQRRRRCVGVVVLVVLLIQILSNSLCAYGMEESRDSLPTKGGSGTGGKNRHEYYDDESNSTLFPDENIDATYPTKDQHQSPQSGIYDWGDVPVKGMNETFDMDLAESTHSFRFFLFVSLRPRNRSVGWMLQDIMVSMFNAACVANNIQVYVVPLRVRSRTVQHLPERWWWQYDFMDAVFWRETHEPVDEATLRYIRRVFRVVVERDEAINMALHNRLGHSMNGVLRVQRAPPLVFDTCDTMPCGDEVLDDLNHNLEEQEDENIYPPIIYVPPCQPEQFPTRSVPCIEPMKPCSPGQFCPLTKYPPDEWGWGFGIPGSQRLDPQHWDWRRYVGLILLLGTLFVTICLAQFAGYRKEMRTIHANWGNLATEEGVDELLRTGWKLRGTRMEIYDKRNIGYRDDDSMLIGGYEQKEFVGAEIVVTHPTRETQSPSIPVDVVVTPPPQNDPELAAVEES